MLNFEQIMLPFGEGDIIYDEAVTFVKKDGIASAPLFFDVDEILSITSADKTITYTNTDWYLKDNQLFLTPNSSIFFFNENDLIFDEHRIGKSFKRTDGKYSLFHEGHFFHDRQISVTYRKKPNKRFDYRESFCKTLLPNTLEKLANKKPLSIVLYGDSISAGANSSGMMVTTPFLPNFGALFCEKLRRHYDCDIRFNNPSVGGKETSWAIEKVETVINYNPDLVLIGFGMNDKIPPDEFKCRIANIVKLISEHSGETEFILFATTLPNTDLEEFYVCQDKYESALYELKKTGIAIANFNKMQAELLKTKRFIDLTGNNVNHPNDFMIRCHAHLLCDMLINH